MLLSQHALRCARTVAGTVSVMLMIDPVVGLLAGIAWFDERVVVTPISLVSAVAAGAAVIAEEVLTHSECRSPSTRENAGEGDRSRWASAVVRMRRYPGDRVRRDSLTDVAPSTVLVARASVTVDPSGDR